MFIAHAPAAYLLANRLLGRQPDQRRYRTGVLILVLAGLAPDLDLLYFYWVDQRQHVHHSYWTHIPVFWLCLCVSLWFPLRYWGSERTIQLPGLVLCGTLLHMSLDSIASGILWLYPLDAHYYGLWYIPSRYDWWIANYILHWTFLLELGIVITAVWVVRTDRPIILALKHGFNLTRNRPRV